MSTAYQADLVASAARILGYQLVIASMMAGACAFGSSRGWPWLGYAAALFVSITAASGAYAVWLRALQYVTAAVTAWLLWDTMDGDPILGWISAYWPHALTAIAVGATLRAFLRKRPPDEDNNVRQ